MRGDNVAMSKERLPEAVRLAHLPTVRDRRACLRLTKAAVSGAAGAGAVLRMA